LTLVPLNAERGQTYILNTELSTDNCQLSTAHMEVTELIIKRLLKIAVMAVVIAGAFTLYANLAIYRAGQAGVYSVENTPPAEAVIVLGAKAYDGGVLSEVLTDRMETGIELYKQGKVKKLLLTGDHGQVTYDEVNNMRLYALKRGIPENDIFMDHAGFSTYDSMYRARDVFKVENAVIVTQKFHLPRALYIARSLGLKVSAVPADRREYIGMEYVYFREFFARAKASAQLVLRSQPKYLGPAIPISGDGRATKDTRI